MGFAEHFGLYPLIRREFSILTPVLHPLKRPNLLDENSVQALHKSLVLDKSFDSQLLTMYNIV